MTVLGAPEWVLVGRKRAGLDLLVFQAGCYHYIFSAHTPVSNIPYVCSLCRVTDLLI